MALPKRKNEDPIMSGSAEPLAETMPLEPLVNGVSPVHELQWRLAARWVDEPVPRWPGAVRLLIVFGGSLMLWACLIGIGLGVVTAHAHG